MAAASAITCNGAGPPDEEAPATSGEEPGCGDLGCPCLSVDRCDVGLCLEGVCSCEYPVNNCPCVDGACFIAEYECVDDICTFDDTPTCGDGYCALRVCHRYDLNSGHRTHFEAQRATIN